MVVEFGKGTWIQKARQQPEAVQALLDKARTDGVLATWNAVRTKLDKPVALGYCSVGAAIDVGPDVRDISIGDRVVSNGQHAEVVNVPMNLCAKVPDGVSDEEAVFTVVGAIGLQGIRLVQPTLGEVVAVTGLGLVGLITVQLLRAHGCRVLGIDFDEARLALARQFGAEVVNIGKGEDPVTAAHLFSRGRGMDAVIITAATRSNEPVRQAAHMCRKRGRIVLVGVTGLELSRADFYEKELSFQVSCSYGPGRYDPNYEQNGQDYPIGFVRWTEQRNFEAVLDMMADQRLSVRPLITHEFLIDEAEKAYDVLTEETPSLGILLRYPKADELPEDRLRRQTVSLPSSRSSKGTHERTEAVLSFVGAGNYATAVLIPAFKAAEARLRMIASISGTSGVHAGRKFGFEETTTDTNEIFADPQVNAVVVATRHDSHARLVCQAIAAGKHVFVEKPLAITLDELAEIERSYRANSVSPHLAMSEGATPLLMVGFNRRFAPQIIKIKALLEEVRGPKAFVMTVNAGSIPRSHWTQDSIEGGGRLIGEACHFVDLLRFLAGSPITERSARSMKGVPSDTVSIQLVFVDGSIGTIHYFTNGAKSFPKERLDVFAGSRVLHLDNFRRLAGFGWPQFRKLNLWRQDKGQAACARAFVDALRIGAPSPIPFDELLEVSQVTISLAEATRR